MGYFKRKLDRRRSRDEARSLNDAPIAWEAIPGRPPKAAFLRFATATVDPDSSRRTGIFSAAYDILDAPEVDPHDATLVREALAWFEKNLSAPKIREPRAVFLFKADATECMQHIWTLAAAMREAGVAVEMQAFANPGRVVYEDEHQVAVVPWLDRREI